MKDTTTLKSITGLTQEEMAILLGITVSQWSMYKSGKRDIPLAAKQQLAALVSNIKKTEFVSKKSKTITVAEQKKEKDWLEQEYKNLQYKEQFLERKISVIENIRSECFAALDTVHYLETRPEKKHLTDFINTVKTRVTKMLNKNALFHLQEMQLKKESVALLKNRVEQELKLHDNTN